MKVKMDIDLMKWDYNKKKYINPDLENLKIQTFLNNKKDITTINPNNFKLENFPIKIIINDSTFMKKASPNHIQILDNESPLYYHVHQQNMLSNLAEIWTNITLNPNEEKIITLNYEGYVVNNIYLNPKKVFLFYDDFSDKTMSNIQETYVNSQIEYNNGYITFLKSNNGYSGIFMNKLFNGGKYIEFKFECLEWERAGDSRGLEFALKNINNNNRLFVLFMKDYENNIAWNYMENGQQNTLENKMNTILQKQPIIVKAYLDNINNQITIKLFNENNENIHNIYFNNFYFDIYNLTLSINNINTPSTIKTNLYYVIITDYVPSEPIVLVS